MLLSAEHLQNLIKQKKIRIKPFNANNLKGIGYTFTLGSQVRIPTSEIPLDPRKPVRYTETLISKEGYELQPGAFALFHTKEKVTLNGKYVCMISTRSSIAQLGLDVSQSSFFAEPDTDNEFILEISNNGNLAVRLFNGTKIAKGVFMDMN